MGRGRPHARGEVLRDAVRGFGEHPEPTRGVAGTLRARRLAVLDRGVRGARPRRRRLECPRGGGRRGAGAGHRRLRCGRLRDDRPLRGVGPAGRRGQYPSRRRAARSCRDPQAGLPRYAARPPGPGAHRADGGGTRAPALRPLQSAALLHLHARVHARRAWPHRGSHPHLEAGARGRTGGGGPILVDTTYAWCAQLTPSRGTSRRRRRSSPTTRGGRWDGRRASAISRGPLWRRCAAMRPRPWSAASERSRSSPRAPRFHPSHRGRARSRLRLGGEGRPGSADAGGRPGPRR